MTTSYGRMHILQIIGFLKSFWEYKDFQRVKKVSPQNLKGIYIFGENENKDGKHTVFFKDVCTDTVHWIYASIRLLLSQFFPVLWR